MMKNQQLVIFLLLFCLMLSLPGLAKSPLTTEDYLKRLQKEIRSDWHPPTLTQSTQVVVMFVIEPDGSISQAKVTQSSGSQIFDEKTLRAVQRQAPIKYIPDSLKTKSHTVEFAFDYHYKGKQLPVVSSPNSIPKCSAPLIAAGGTHVHVIDEENAVYGNYVKLLKEKILSNWTIPQGVENKALNVFVTLTREGQPCGLVITNPSQQESLNQSLRTAVKDSAPYTAFPAEIKEEAIRVNIMLESSKSP